MWVSEKPLWRFQEASSATASTDFCKLVGRQKKAPDPFVIPHFEDNSDFRHRIIRSSLGAASSVNC